jgi:hypothetical protein
MEMLLIVSILVVIDSTAEEDVQSFERSVLSGPQSSEANANTGSESDSAGKDSDAEVPVKRKVRAIQDLGLLKNSSSSQVTARMSIMAFLGDESESE